jgi:hypothetical protein
MTGPQPHSSEGFVCTRCTGANGAHYLTCPTLRLPAGPLHSSDSDKEEEQ